MIKPNLCDWNGAYIYFNGIIKVLSTAAQEEYPNNRNKKLKNLAPFTNCISQTKSVQVDDAHDIDVVMAMSNLLECSKT